MLALQEGNDKTSMRGVQFMISSQEGAYWILFASEPITLVLDNSKRTTITSTTPFTGILRIAYIPAEEASDTSTFISTGLRRLIYHAGVYPTGAQISWDFHSQPTAPSKNKIANTTTSSSRKAAVHFSFATRSMTDDSSYRTNNAATGLLMLALPHHVQILPKSVQLNGKRFDLTYSCIKGPLTPIVGSDWAMEEPLPTLDFDDSPYHDLDPGVRQTILDQVADDMNRVLPTNDENVYGYGKQVARLAQLAHIANILENEKESQSNDDDKGSIASKVKELLMSYLENFLTSQVSDYLLYDGNIGGLVSKNGLSDKSADFGNGRYVLILFLLSLIRASLMLPCFLLGVPCCPGTMVRHTSKFFSVFILVVLRQCILSLFRPSLSLWLFIVRIGYHGKARSNLRR